MKLPLLKDNFKMEECEFNKIKKSVFAYIFLSADSFHT
jgi:hypothetical protein